jgi:ankyrin repeat/SOCS box protein 16
MAGESFPFTSSTLRALRLQREWLDWEDRRRAAAQQCRRHRDLPCPQAQLLRPRRSCRDPAVHNALFSGDLQQLQILFQDEDAANMIVETVSNQLAWSAEQGREHHLGGQKRDRSGGWEGKKNPYATSP